MKGRIDTGRDYQSGMPHACSEAMRTLRSLGFAVVVVTPDVVGLPTHRGRVELAMLNAGVQRAKELKHFRVTGVK